MSYSTTEKGIIVAVRQLQHKCRIQVPRTVRDDLKLKDGDTIYWVKTKDGRFVVEKAVVEKI